MLDYLQAKAEILEDLRVRNGWKYAGFESLVLSCGREMKAVSLPPAVKRGASQACFYNCQKVATRKKQFTYVEGYALANGLSIALAHAWLMTDEGYAIEPTWDATGICYFGIPLKIEWIHSINADRLRRGRKKDLSMIEGNYLERFSLLKEGFPEEAIAQ